MTEYREGDLVRVTDKQTGEGYQVRLRVCPVKSYPNGSGGETLFAPSDPNEPWEKWTFLDYLIGRVGSQQYNVELVEKAPEPVKRAPGLYRDADGDLFKWDGAVWRWDDGLDADVYNHTVEKPERLFTKEEVMRIVRKAAWDVDPDYVYQMGAGNKIIKKLEESL